MKEYAEYKNFNSFWIDRIPKEWKFEKIKYLFDERVEKNHPNETCLVASQHMGVVPKNIYGQRTVEVMKDLHLLKLVEVGDFVISLRSFQGGLEYAYYRGIISPAYTILKNKGEISSGYFKYLAKSSCFINLLKTCVTGIREGQNIDYSLLKNYFLPIPPISEQNAIVEYLDKKTKQIDEFVSAKEKEIEALNELKKSVVADAVTKGISGEELIDSGIEWLPKVPNGWKSSRCKFLFREINNRAENESYIHLSMSQKLGLIPDSDLDGKHLLSESYDGAKICDKDNLVLNRLKAHLNVFALSPCKGVVSPDYTVLEINKNLIHPKYAEYILRNPILKRELVIRVKGIVEGFWRLYTNDFNTIVLPIPPMNEQEKIVNYLNEKISNIDILIFNAKKQIDLVKELRTKIIADAVTGKVDVRK